MSLSNKEIKNYVKPAIEDIRNVEKIFLEARESYDLAPDRIDRSATSVREEGIQEKLQQMPIEDLKKPGAGIRITALKNAGFRNILQLYGVDARRLANLRGLGPETAQTIYNRVQEVVYMVKHNAAVRLSSSERDPAKDLLVFEIYKYRKLRDYIDKIQSGIDEYDEQIAPLSKKFEKKTSFFGLLFSSSKKRDLIKSDFDGFSDNIISPYIEKYGVVSESVRLILECDISDCWEDFSLNAASYYSIIDSFTSGGEGETKYDVTGSSGQFNLPKELVDEISKVELDNSLMKTELRRYQEFGSKYIVHQKRVLLGDEMGLGKTIQTIAVMAHYKAKGRKKFLVVCPLSVMINWEREITKHSELEPIVMHGGLREDKFREWNKNGGVGITTYETLSKLPLHEIDYVDVMAVDEAHNVKNPNAIRTENVVRIVRVSDIAVYMTGTPLENRLEEMISLISALNPSLGMRLRNSYNRSQGNYAESIAEIYLRRVREDVLKELPEMINVEDWLMMNSDETTMYVSKLERSHNLMGIRRVSWDVSPNRSTKLKRLLEICDDAKEEGRKVIVFSFFLDTLQMIEDALGDRCLGKIYGGISADKRQNMIDEYTAAGDGAVFLSQIVSGGTGLNIQAASIVILCEPQFKPSIENQAISRVYRMGQINNVVVHRLLMKDSIDERMLNLVYSKQALFDKYADRSVVGDTDLMINEKDALRDLIAAERKRLGVIAASDSVEDADSDCRDDSNMGEKTKVNMQRSFGWFWYFSGDERKLEKHKCGKWMHFFSDQEFAKKICEKAIEKNACYECKCTDMELTGEATGVICFYLNGDDIENHKRVIQFMLDNDLINTTKSGRFYNLSFKFDDQTRAGEYGSDFEGKIKLEQFIDLATGEWIYKE